MRRVVLPLLVSLVMSGCGSSKSSTTTTTSATGIWNADLLGGSGEASGFSFTTQFTLNSDGSLNIAYFQLLTSGTCLPIAGGTESGSMTLSTNSTTSSVTGPFTYTVNASGNTLTLSGTVTGTATTTGSTGTTLTGGSATGTWTLAGSTGCTATGGTFTMTQTS